MSSPVVHFEIQGKEAGKLHWFYNTVFGWEVDANNPLHYGVIRATGEGGIGGGISQAGEDEGPGVTFYIQVPDLQAALDQIEEMGGKTAVPPTEVPGMVTLAMFYDPEGNLLGLVKG